MDEDDFDREEQYDLLTAAILGLAIGVGATLLLRTGPSGRPITPALRAAGRGANWAGARSARGARWAGQRAAEGAEWARDQAEDLWDRVPVDEIQERIGDYLDAARETISDTVESEMRDLRKAIRRRRRKLGI